MTFTRLEVLLSVADLYFAPHSRLSTSDLPSHWKHVLGDDRWLTQLIASQSMPPGVVDIYPNVVSETEPAGLCLELFAQRRRWLLARLSTEAMALANPRFWVCVPLLSAYRLCFIALRNQNTNLQSLLLVCAMAMRGDTLTPYFASITLGATFVDWTLHLSFGLSRRRTSVYMFPLYLAAFPVFMITLRFYTLLTLTRRSWGGPRDR